MRCWADRATALIFLLVAAILGFLDLTGGHSWSAWIEILWFLSTRYLLPLWLFLRLVDLVFGGPGRRRGQVRATLIRP